ncbi:MAG: hypothetical protein ABIG91_03100, partial [Patescibacteria group bacterium]
KKCLENFSVLLAEAKRGRAETLDGTIQNPLADFVQRMFELRPKDTANFHFLDFGRNFGQVLPRPCGARHYILRGFSKHF